ncbi:class I SAM-dependent methyltransferase [Desulfurococcus amylolyticus]|uniref:class I SAM-dependent methyltransferase n=1 Tax=Desulfurococcus amylolyticus TaxID=94694 RepID=UPI0005B1F465|nr:class I SAM-dependent methyltransferase [Desulfurococcus amylolyticus]
MSSFNEEYFRRLTYFGYRFRTWRAIVRLYEDVLRRASSVVGVNMLDGRGKRALDVGCALGVTTRWLASLGYEAVGLDISEVIGVAKRVNPKLEFVQADALSMPFAPCSFDLIVAFKVFEHLPNAGRFILSLWRTLREGGVVIITAESRTLVRLAYDLLGGERTHINLRKPHEAEEAFKRAFNNVFVIRELLLPIPPHLLNRYFVIYGVPNHLESGYVLIAWNKVGDIQCG